MLTWALKFFELFGETLTACLFDEIWCVSFNWPFCDVLELPLQLHEFLVAEIIREAIEVKAFDILFQMQFFESAQIKALLHLEYLSIKLTNTLVMHALILLPDLIEGLFNFIVSFLLINGDRLQM